MHFSKQKIGVIGGVGPKPTVNFYLELVEQYKNAMKGQYPEVLIYSIPVSAELESFMIAGATEGPIVDEAIEDISRGFDILDQSGIQTKVIVCNTLSHYAKLAGYENFINPVDTTLDTIIRWGVKKVGLIATSATLKLELYQRRLSEHDIDLILPFAEEQKIIVRYILNQLQNKIEEGLEDQVCRILKRIYKYADTIILGCTDLYKLLDRAKEFDVHLVDSNRMLSNKALGQLLKADKNEANLLETCVAKPEATRQRRFWTSYNELRRKRSAYGEMIWMDKIEVWMKDFISKPDPRLGRTGAVCPFVPRALAEEAIFLTSISAETVSVRQLVECMIEAALDFNHYPTKMAKHSLFKSFIVIFPQLRVEDHSKLKTAIQIAKPIIIAQGITIGEFYPENPDASIHNKEFFIAQSPVPLFVVRTLAAHDELFLSPKPELFKLYRNAFNLK